MSDEPQFEVVLACFDGRRTAGRSRRRLSAEVKAGGARILDEVVLVSSERGKARVYDPRRTVAGTLTPALTWGVFGLVASGGSWKSLVIWAVVGAVCGALYAYYAEHLLTKHDLQRLGRQLSADSSALMMAAVAPDAGALDAAATGAHATVASVVTIGPDLSATVRGAPTGDDRDTILNMLVIRYRGAQTAQRVFADVGGKSAPPPTVETELLIHTDRDGRCHVASPSAGARTFAESDLVAWGAFGLVFGAIVGFGGSGGLFGALEEGVVTGLAWALFGVVAGALYGLWAGRAVSARRLDAWRPILEPDTSMVVAWAVGRLPASAVAAWSADNSQQLVVRFDRDPRGAVLGVSS